MAAFKMSFEHAQPWDLARERFETGVARAAEDFRSVIKTVEWSEDKTSARLEGRGFDVTLKLQPEALHAEGQVPFMARLMLETPIRKFLEETFRAHDENPS